MSFTDLHLVGRPVFAFLIARYAEISVDTEVTIALNKL